MSENANLENKVVVVPKDDARVLELLGKLRDFKNVISNGLHEATIASLEFREMTDQFKKCETVVLVPTFDVTSDEGEEAALIKYISLTWSDKSNLKKLAKATGTLPTQGELFNPDNLVGARLVVSVENEDRDSRTISKIVDFFPSKKAKKAPAPIDNDNSADDDDEDFAHIFDEN